MRANGRVLCRCSVSHYPSRRLHLYIYFQPNSLVDLESLTLPTGGVISWTYGQTDVSGDKVLTRTVVANGQTSLWKYNYAMSSTQGANTSNVVTVTDPFLNDTQYTCTIYAPNPLGLPSTAQLQPCYMTKEQAFTGCHKRDTGCYQGYRLQRHRRSHAEIDDRHLGSHRTSGGDRHFLGLHPEFGVLHRQRQPGYDVSRGNL